MLIDGHHVDLTWRTPGTLGHLLGDPASKIVLNENEGGVTQKNTIFGTFDTIFPPQPPSTYGTFCPSMTNVLNVVFLGTLALYKVSYLMVALMNPKLWSLS